jgi:ADP-heptose:LPS heptosyltransferase
LHGAAKRLAHDYWPGKWSSMQWLQTTLVPVGAKHNVQRNLDLVRALGIAADPATSYVVPPSWMGERNGARRVAIHVGTVTHHGLANKRWAADNFLELARRLASKGYEIHVIAGPDEREESQRIVAAVAGAKIVEGRIDEIARFLSTCSAAVTNDSGIGHLAAAVGTKVLALHGPTPVEGGPYGPNAVRFRPSTCPACFDPRLRNTSCVLDIDFVCLKEHLTVERAEHAFESLIEGS